MEKNQKDERFLLLCAAAGVLLILILGWQLYGILFPGSGSESDAVSTVQETETAALPDQGVIQESLPAETDLVKRTERTIDFEALWGKNKDVYAWIEVPGTAIDYPILRHPTNDTYYLNYNMDGTKGYPGCIYTENLNSKDFTDNNTVLYGHNMKNGTMFAGLHNFADKDFFTENNQVIIFLPDRTLYYEIFAAYKYDDRHLLQSFDFADEDVYANYLAAIYENKDSAANINRESIVTGEETIITLSTCVANQDDKRYLVQAVLREEVPLEETLQAE